MSTDPRPERTLGQLVASATEDISALIRSEIALAKAEIAVQAKKGGVAAGLLAGAAVVLFYSVYFIFITLAEGIQAMGLPRWASFLIVTVLMLLVAAVLGWLGVRKMKTVQPSPDKAIASTQQSVAGIKAALANPGTVVPAPPPSWDPRVAKAMSNRPTASVSATRATPPATPASSADTTVIDTTGTTGKPDPSRDA
ncbi:putative superfamily III holin-X [Humibacillus xanthopallidus]|uniref:Putative superfamily III holin-X n=1 Tax=Humibacillus xanthopallidus TaxID=412689 RepID=A0A543PMD4_9MICO|nr:phage holin family protein [Humibacillus xanthopallidus]TQN45230.1 putative superfamily III holin-X [Humibacillus xanthopallidus]